MKGENLEEINEKFKTLANAKFMKAPITNQEIWRKIDNNSIKKRQTVSEHAK